MEECLQLGKIGAEPEQEPSREKIDTSDTRKANEEKESRRGERPVFTTEMLPISQVRKLSHREVILARQSPSFCKSWISLYPLLFRK